MPRDDARDGLGTASRRPHACALVAWLLAASCGDDASRRRDAGMDASTLDAGADAGATDSAAERDASADGAATDSGSPVPCSLAGDYPLGAPLEGLEMLDGWIDPREVPEPVSTPGWEDSTFVSADGCTLYFGYSRLDFEALSMGRTRVTGPDRPGQVGATFDIYEARVEGGDWHVSRSTVNAAGDVHEAAIGVNAAETRMAFVRFDGPGTLLLSERPTRDEPWGAPERLPPPFDTPCVEDNPHLSPDGTRLWFDSNRVDLEGTGCRAEPAGPSRDFWVADLAGGVWSTPERIRWSAAETTMHWQLFAIGDGSEIDWTGTDPTCGAGRACLYRASRDASGAYGAPVVIARSSAGSTTPNAVFSIGEMSITADGRWMFFTYARRTSDGALDLSVGAARRAM